MARRDEILTTALSMFLRSGYEGTTLDAIADAVGVTKPAVYYHFKSKDELFRTLFLGLFGELAESYLAMLAADITVADLLESLFSQLREVEREFASPDAGVVDFAYLPLMLDGARRFPELHDAIEAFYVRAIDLIAERLEVGRTRGEIRPDLDCRTAATALVAQFEGQLLVGSVMRSSTSRGAESGLAELFRRGMEPA